MYLFDNNLKSLDLSNNSALIRLYISGNPFIVNDYVYLNSKYVFHNNLVKLSNNKEAAFKRILSSTNDYAADNDEGTITFFKANKYSIEASYYYEYELADDSFIITFKLNVVQLKSNKYKIDNDNNYIYIGTDNDVNQIKNNLIIPEGTDVDIDLNSNKLQIKYKDQTLNEFELLNLKINNYKVLGNVIFIPYKSETTYNDFIENIEVNGVTYKIYKDNSEVTSGSIERGMILKVYKDDTILDDILITDEYLEFDGSLNLSEQYSYIYKIKEKTKIEELLSKINTSGEISFKDKDGRELVNSDIISTGSKINIEIANKNIEYTLIVSGDTTGDGIVNISDVIKLADHIITRNILNNYEKIAAEVTNNDNLNISDVIKLADYILDRSIEIWR